MDINNKETKQQSSGRKLLNDFRTLSNKILRYAKYGPLRTDFLREVSQLLIDFSGSDLIEIWLQEHNRCYRSRTMRSSKKPFHLEIMPYSKKEDADIIFYTRGNPCLNLLCKKIINGDFDSNLTFFTKNGSFWTGDTEKPLIFCSQFDKKMKSHNLSIGKNYKSLALIPIIIANENVGFVHLRSFQGNYFSEYDIDFYEGIVQALGVALRHRLAEVLLRERVKELTCLFGIAKISAQPKISFEELLQNIVSLLPPAWLYPDIASARIIVDDSSYITSNFQESPYKQTADIISNGEKRGIIEVLYAEKRVELDEGAFLKEERNLIDAIAKEIATIIERKQNEKDKILLQEQLRHADRLATVGQLTAGVAHELNEPLSSILGFAQLAQKCSDIPEQAEKDIDKIIKASLHAREIVKKLMLFSRQMPTKKTQVNLNQIIIDALYFLEARCVKEGIQIVYLLESNLPELIVDSSQLQQVIVNLVVNAIHSMHSGGTLTIQTVVHNKDYISLIAKDTGIGMSAEILKQIFIPFFTTKDVGEGTGLGLPVVHGIVTSHGGTITVESEVGKGTRFEIQFPIN